METVRGIVDHDTIRLVTPLSLPQGAEIEFEPRIVQVKQELPPIGSNAPELYALLSERFNSGDSDRRQWHSIRHHAIHPE